MPLVTLNSLKRLWYVTIARRELGLDHSSDPDTPNLREFNSSSGNFESAALLDVNLKG